MSLRWNDEDKAEEREGQRSEEEDDPPDIHFEWNPAESMDNDEGFEEMEDDDVEMTEEEVFEKIKLL